MVKYIPKWLIKRLSKLWAAYKEKEFTFEEATKALPEDDPRNLAMVLSDLNKSGWIETKQDPKNKRKTLYKIKQGSIVNELIKIEL